MSFGVGILTTGISVGPKRTTLTPKDRIPRGPPARGSVPKWSTSAMPFPQRENIKLFLDAAERMRVSSAAQPPPFICLPPSLCPNPACLHSSNGVAFYLSPRRGLDKEGRRGVTPGVAPLPS